MSGESILLAMIASMPGLLALIGTLRKDAATAKKTSSEREQLEDEITERVLKRANEEIEKYQRQITALEVQLDAANKLIGELMERDQKREAAMNDLKKQFDSDTLLRANIEKALAVANDKIAVLTTELQAEREARKSERADFQKQLDERDQIILNLQNQITQLKRSQTSGGLLTR